MGVWTGSFRFSLAFRRSDAHFCPTIWRQTLAYTAGARRFGYPAQSCSNYAD